MDDNKSQAKNRVSFQNARPDMHVVLGNTDSGACENDICKSMNLTLNNL